MKAKPTIRRADRNDAITLSALGKSTFIETFGDLYKPADLQAYLNDSHALSFYERVLADDAHAVWIAEDETGDAVAYCICGPCGLPAPDMPENSGELHRLYIQKNQQGSGLGRSFMGVAISWLEARYEHLYVGVYAENTRAQRLYQSYGFEKITDYIFMVGEHPDPEWIMKRTTC